MSVVGSSSSVQRRRPSAAWRRAPRRPVVGDRGGEQRDVDVVERERGVEHRLRGRGRDRLDAGGRRDGEVRGEQDDLGAAPARLLGERDAHPPGRAVADEADGVDRLARAAGGDEHALAGEAPRREQLPDPRGDLVGLGHPADAPLALGRLALVGPDELDAARRQRLDVRARRRVRPHARVHRGRDEHGPAVGERRLGEHVVGEPVGELRERVRRARRDDEQVGARQVLVEIVAGGPAGERGEGLGADEPLGAGRDERDHVVPALDEQARQLAGLVGGDPAGDAEQDPAHARIVPATARCGCSAAAAVRLEAASAGSRT